MFESHIIIRRQKAAFDNEHRSLTGNTEDDARRGKFCHAPPELLFRTPFTQSLKMHTVQHTVCNASDFDQK